MGDLSVQKKRSQLKHEYTQQHGEKVNDHQRRMYLPTTVAYSQLLLSACLLYRLTTLFSLGLASVRVGGVSIVVVVVEEV